MNDKQKEIMHEICKIEYIFPYWNSIIVGDSVQNPKMCQFGTFDKDLIWYKYRVSHYINKISAPTLDVCYHIKHKNIILTKSKDAWFDTYRYLNYSINGVALALAASEENICIHYGDTIIDIKLFNDTEKKVIRYYVNQRINEIVEGEKQKEKEAVEQKRKELIDMFNNI